MQVPLIILLMCLFGLVEAQQPAAQRRPLPKPSSGSRGFEQYKGHDAESRLVAAGATREVINPRKPVAPLEGLAYDPRPYFMWEAAPSSKTYHFVLYEDDAFALESAKQPAKVLYETDVATTEFRYPAQSPSLMPGKLYSWRVITTGANGKEVGPPVTFFVLAGKDAAELKMVLEKANLSAPKTVAQTLQQARLFEEYGVWYDALRVASNVAAQNPTDDDAQNYYNSLLERLDDKSVQ
jgi:hypothetical protein